MENRKPLEQALRPIEDTDVTTWDLPEGAIGRLGQGGLRGVEFSPCGRYLVSEAWWCRGLDKAPIRIWEVATGAHIHTFSAHSTDVQDVVFSPDGTLLASGSFDGTVLIWDMKPFIGS